MIEAQKRLYFILGQPESGQFELPAVNGVVPVAVIFMIVDNWRAKGVYHVVADTVKSGGMALELIEDRFERSAVFVAAEKTVKKDDSFPFIHFFPLDGNTEDKWRI
jgi:hypothetical protein